MFKFLKDIKSLEDKNQTLRVNTDLHKIIIDRHDKEIKVIQNDIRSMSCFMHDLKSELDALNESPQPGSGPVPIPPSS